MKFTKPQISSLYAFIHYHRGCAPVSEWTTGHGRHTRKRVVPVFAQEMGIGDAMALPGLSGKNARRLNKARPRVARVIVVVNRRNANLALKEWMK